MTLYRKTLFILVSGKAGVGKTTTRGILAAMMRKDGHSVYTDSFALGVKQTACNMGWDGEKDARGRAFLQKIGQLGRWYNPNIWVNQLIHRYDTEAILPFDAIIVDDWRFPNELVRVTEYGEHDNLSMPITIRIEASEREILKGTPEYNEESEVSLPSVSLEHLYYDRGNIDDYNFVILNHNDMEELESKISILYANLKNLREIIKW